MPKITDISMIGNFIFAVFLFVFNCGPFVFSENRAFQKRIEELRLKNVPEEEKDDAREMAKSMYSNNTLVKPFIKRAQSQSKACIRVILFQEQCNQKVHSQVDKIQWLRENRIRFPCTRQRFLFVTTTLLTMEPYSVQ